MRILITAGPTREYFDDVRFISNASSGKMGYALAAEAARRGHQVVLVSGPVELAAPPGVERVPVVTGREMLEACLNHFETCDAAVMCAAVCDYRPATRTEGKALKIPTAHSVTLEPTEDICATLGRRKGHRVVVGFALESIRTATVRERNQARARAETKLQSKHCDAIVLNHAGGIGADETSVEVFVGGEGWSPPRSGSKTELAVSLVDLLARLVSGFKPPTTGA
jgi:phosphopantothenoylcysteine decarboxylase/phosphopantothenate--cysteine ligase